MASPVLSKNSNFNNTPVSYQLPETGTTGRITVEGVLQKTGISFAVLLVAAAVGWQLPILALPGLIGGLIIAIVMVFRREPSPALTLMYAAFEGALLGAISHFFEASYPGIVLQAVLGSFAVATVVFAMFAFAGVRATRRGTKIFLAITLGYLLFSLANLALILTGANTDPYGLRGSVEIFGIPLGIVLGALAVCLASYSLIMDFTYVENAVRKGVDKRYGWTAAYGIMVSMVWLYIEILRILGLSRR